MRLVYRLFLFFRLDKKCEMAYTIREVINTMKLIERKFYLQQLIDVMDTPDIKVITGIRRSGKSKLMDAFISYVQEQSAQNNVVRIN